MGKNLLYITFLFLGILLSSCSVIAGIFKAGVWVGVFFILAIIALVIFFISKASGDK